MCFGGGSDSSSSGSASARADVAFNPTITIGSNSQEPARDTASTFAAALLAAPVARVAMPQPTKETAKTDQTTTILAGLALALAAKKLLKG